LGHRTFDVFWLLKSEYRYKSMDLLFFRGIVNFKTINTFLEQRFFFLKRNFKAEAPKNT
jgi:hypothetical protein